MIRRHVAPPPMKHLLPPALCLFALAAAARADSTFSYTLSAGQATITGFADAASASGALIIPAAVDGYPVVAVGRGAFRNRAALTGLAFSGSGVTSLGPQAFQGCAGLVSATLPSGLAALPPGAFLDCTALAAVSLPSTLADIGAGAFAGCSSLAYAPLPAVLTSLGDGAFENCSALAAASLPAGLASVPVRAFAGCRSLASLELHAGLVSIGAGAFADADGLVAVALPASLVTLGDGAFRDCDALASITLGAGLTTLGEGFVDGCEALGAIAVADGNPAYHSVDGVLFDSAQSTLLLAPRGLVGAYVVPAGVASVGPGAFYYAEGMDSITLPDSLVAVGAWAFGGCSGLVEVTFPAGVASIADDGFHYAASLSAAIFAGDAPAMGATVFDDTASGFAVYYLSAASGFASGLAGYQAVPLATGSVAVAGWLSARGYAASVDPADVSGSGGVPLLLCYAFGLEPEDNPAAALPRAEVVDDELALSFRAAADDVAYVPQASSDLQNWSTDGLRVLGPDADGYVTVVAPLGEKRVFLRVVVATE